MNTHPNDQLATRLVHLHGRDPVTGASSLPIYQCSTFHQEDPEHLGEWDYSRSGNPTRAGLEQTIANLESGARGLAFATGMAAISSTLMLLETGAHVIATQDIYGGAHRVLSRIFERWGLQTSFVDATSLENIAAALRPNTRMVYLETPSNPLLRVTPLQSLIDWAREHKLVVVIDNTFSTPYLQRPLELGADIVVHSATKFLAGHSDVVAGLAVTREASVGARLAQIQNGFGAVLGPQDSWLVQRGLRTLAVRLEAQQTTASALALWLRSQSSVQAVHHLSLGDHPGRDTHFSQASGPGAVLAFDLGSRERAVAFLKDTRLPLVGVSLGGTETILSYPATMSHAAVPPSVRLERGITDGLVRLSAGLEDLRDLQADLGQALQTIDSL